MYETIRAREKIMFRVLDFCTCTPLTRVHRSSACVTRLVEGDQRRAAGRRSIDCLAGQPLRTSVLQIACGDVVEDGHPREVVEGLALRHAMALTTDHDGELAFEVEIGGHLRAVDALLRADEAARELGEDVGMIGELATRLSTWSE